MSLELQKMHTMKAKAERIPEGTYMSRISSIIDLGIQPQTDWQTGEPTDPKNRVLFTWELPTEVIVVEHEDGSNENMPRLISKEYTLSTYERANLMQLIKAMKPGCEDLKELLDMTCMVSVGSTVNGNAKVTAVVPVPKGMPVEELSKPASFFDFDAPVQELFDKQPNWVQEKLKGAENYNGFADGWGKVEKAA
jgi:hypothetical protein